MFLFSFPSLGTEHFFSAANPIRKRIPPRVLGFRKQRYQAWAVSVPYMPGQRVSSHWVLGLISGARILCSSAAPPVMCTCITGPFRNDGSDPEGKGQAWDSGFLISSQWCWCCWPRVTVLNMKALQKLSASVSRRKCSYIRVAKLTDGGSGGWGLFHKLQIGLFYVSVTPFVCSLSLDYTFTENRGCVFITPHDVLLLFYCYVLQQPTGKKF